MPQNSIRILSQLFYPELISTGQTVTELAEGLVQQGVDVDVYCAPPSLAKFHTTSHMTHAGITIHRVWATAFPKKQFFGKLINHFTFAISLFFTLLFKPKRPILVFTNPPFLGVIAALLKTIRGIPFIYVVFDVYPDTAIQLGVLSKQGVLSKLWRILNRYIYTKADRIILIGRCMYDILKADIPAQQHRVIRVIPVWGDDQSIHDQIFKNPTSLKSEWHAEGKFVIGYSGNMGRFHDIETILTAAKQLQSHSDILFLFSGDGHYRYLVENYIQKFPNSNCQLRSYFPRETFGRALASFDLGVVSLLESQVGLSVPSKTFGLMAAGVPILGLLPPASEIALIVKEENCGFCVQPRDQEALITTLLHAKNNPEILQRMGQNGKMAIQKKYSLHQAVSSYYNEIITLQENI